MKPFLHVGFAVAVSVLVSRHAFAQSFRRGVESFNQGDFANAALVLYDVAVTSEDSTSRDDAVIYLAQSLHRMGLWAPASFYYQVILEQGSGNPHFLHATEELLGIQSQYHDHIFAVDLIDRFFDGEAFANLPNRERVNQINFLMGQLNLRRGMVSGARRFLEFVEHGTAYEADARYLLGLVSLRTDRPGEALEHFQTVVDHAQSIDRPNHRSVSDLARLAKARTAYGVGQYDQARDSFESIPRASEFWFRANYEKAWAYYQLQDFGQALGALETVLSPYFVGRHVPEAYVIQATTYFSLCQWDRVRRTIDQFTTRYGPMKSRLDAYLAESRSPGRVFDDLLADGRGHYSAEIAREIRRAQWFKDFYFAVQHLQWQRDELLGIEPWRDSRLAADLALMIRDKLENTRDFAGSWVRQQLVFLADSLKNFKNQVDILDFEVADAERQWLEQGREILKERRDRLPRPKIPSDQWQHWSVGREYWRDELGYYRHTLESECH